MQNNMHPRRKGTPSLQLWLDRWNWFFVKFQAPHAFTGCEHYSSTSSATEIRSHWWSGVRIRILHRSRLEVRVKCQGLDRLPTLSQLQDGTKRRIHNATLQPLKEMHLQVCSLSSIRCINPCAKHAAASVTVQVSFKSRNLCLIGRYRTGQNLRPDFT